MNAGEVWPWAWAARRSFWSALVLQDCEHPWVPEGPIVLRWSAGERHAVLDLVKIAADGSAFVRFADRSSIELPALKGEM